MKKFFVCLMSVMIGTVGNASDTAYVRRITDTLSSRFFLGRGYVNDGMRKACTFIEEEMKQIGLQTQRQAFKYPVNVFAGDMSLTVNGLSLMPGVQFIVKPGSKPATANGNLQQADSITWIATQEHVMIKLVDKLTWSVSGEQADFTAFDVLKSAVKEPSSFSCDVDAKLNKNFSAANIVGTIKGTGPVDSIIVFTAHYDHLGAMGKEAYFPGANDNAGGVAMLLDLAKYYIENPPQYTTVLIAFAGEEAGLIGSKYFVDHPLLELKKIRFLVNLDLMGNGEEGITVVNATEFPDAFKLLQDINNDHHLLATVNSRGKAANSDHYWFTEKGVPSFFIYTLGKRKDYHDVHDIAATVPFYEVDDLEQLVIRFADKISGGQ